MALKTTQVWYFCASTLLPSAQRAQVYWIALTLLHTHTPALLRKKLRQSGKTFSQPSANQAHQPAYGAQRERERGRQTKRKYLLLFEKARNLWIGVWICMRERKLLRLPVEWHWGWGASFCLPDLQMALWTQVSTRDVKECHWDPPSLIHSLLSLKQKQTDEGRERGSGRKWRI